jgi:hypothetical protein
LDPRADNTRVDRITVNRALTGGYDRDARLGDAGVTVLVEPRDSHGQLVPAAGPVSVVILDRGRWGNAARVARWDFTAEQTASLYRKTPYGEGIFLEMPWPGAPPDRSHLHMFVRYTTQDGRNLEASRELDVALPARRQQGWTPLATSAVEPPAIETADTGLARGRVSPTRETGLAETGQRGWRANPRPEPEPAVEPAVSHEKAPELLPRTEAPPARPLVASDNDETQAEREPARAPPSRLQRPAWSPLRP